MHTWDLWYPKAAATGLPFARCQIDPAGRILVHAAPPVLNVTVRDELGKLVAEGCDLAATCDSPMAMLTIQGSKVMREDLWPTTQELDCLVVLPGGEAGFLKQWWHADDHSEWRWQAEFYNRR